MIRKCEKRDCEIERIYPKDGMGKFYEECPECRKEKIEKLWDIPVTDSSTVFNCPPISYGIHPLANQFLNGVTSDEICNNLVPNHTGFPYSRDFEANIKCENVLCICNDLSGNRCAVPSNCEIDNSGNCKWYLKQKEKEQKGKHEGN